VLLGQAWCVGNTLMVVRLASSVVLVRNAIQGPEILMVQRSSKSSFAKSMFAFPGGAVDEHDRSSSCSILKTSAPSDMDVLKIAALRELFEETEIFLSNPKVPREKFHPWVERVHSSPNLFPNCFADLGTSPTVSTLYPWCRFVTPEAEPKRFDTQFFVACCDSENSDFKVDGSEIVDAKWLDIRTAIRQCNEGQLRMLPPQWLILQDLAPYSTCEAIVKAALTRDTYEQTSSNRPKFLFINETTREVTIALPGDEEHDENPVKGQRNRIKCATPMGGPYFLERTLLSKI
jgi:8-oxo-dGTP pyrophosphatase MutT (NUDIX family)